MCSLVRALQDISFEFRQMRQKTASFQGTPGSISSLNFRQTRGNF